MANKYIDLSTVKFLMNNVQELESILNKKRFADHNLESIDMFIDSVKQFADRELFPKKSSSPSQSGANQENSAPSISFRFLEFINKSFLTKP